MGRLCVPAPDQPGSPGEQFRGPGAGSGDPGPGRHGLSPCDSQTQRGGERWGAGGVPWVVGGACPGCGRGRGGGVSAPATLEYLWRLSVNCSRKTGAVRAVVAQREGGARRPCFRTDAHNAVRVVILGGTSGPRDGSLAPFTCAFLCGLKISNLVTPLSIFMGGIIGPFIVLVLFISKIVFRVTLQYETKG